MDFAALDAHDQGRFNASLKTAQARLEAMKPLLGQGVFHVVGQSHMDAAWLWPWTETVDVVRRTFQSSLQLMNEYPQYTYSQSAAQYYEWMAQKYPGHERRNRQAHQGRRWEVVGGMWVEPDLNLPTASRWCASCWSASAGSSRRTASTSALAGTRTASATPWQLPQIYKKSGVDYFVTTKMTWNDTNRLPVLAVLVAVAGRLQGADLSAAELSMSDLNPAGWATTSAIARNGLSAIDQLMDLYGVGDHGGGPTRVSIDEGLHWTDPTAGGAAEVRVRHGPVLLHAVETQIAADSPSWSYASIAKGYTPPPA